MENPKIEKRSFTEVDLNDTFFDSLRDDYKGFDTWFNKKKVAGESAFITITDNRIDGFLYLKEENNSETYPDIVPTLHSARRLKVGTFKINPHGTKLGEFYVRKILHDAAYEGFEEIYVTIFSKHGNLINLLETYGFSYHGVKGNEENVYVKKLNSVQNDIYLDYPKINTNSDIYLLGIYPEYHTRLFNESILRTERNREDELIQDISYANSINKVYICKIDGVMSLKKGDILVMYRTKDEGKSAGFSSVATTICTVTDIENISKYMTVDEYVAELLPFTVFSEAELRQNYITKRYPYIIKFIANFPLPRKIILSELINRCGIPNNDYWGFRKLTSEQFQKITTCGGVYANFIIN